MYSYGERNECFEYVVRALQEYEFVEGIVQLGSGVVGYKDAFSDIDLMVVAEMGNETSVKDSIIYVLKNYGNCYVKEKILRNDVFLLIGIIYNGLELNISVVNESLLSVKSPLWKVIVDKTGTVTDKMTVEHVKFLGKEDKYGVGYDIPFEYVYGVMVLEKELTRGNMIYAMKMLDHLREMVLSVQSLNEDKKLHQFKEYDTLDDAFIDAYLSTFPVSVTTEHVKESIEKVNKLFVCVLGNSERFKMDRDLKALFLDVSNMYKG